jgi:steroid 5-alpha reductase family enzyme
MIFALAAGLVLVMVEMTVTWWMARRVRNYGIVDIVWSLGFAPIAWVFAGVAAWRFHDAKLDGFPEWSMNRALLLTAMVTVWAMRLGLHLYVRVRAHHPVEDVRYAELRKEWGGATDWKMYRFYLMQGGVQWVLALPFAWVCLDGSLPTGWGGLGISGVLGFVLWLGGIVGESVADAQLKRFRSDPTKRGQVCREGMWRYSRHPNYFFEWLIWVGYAVFAMGAPWGWVGWLSPVLMLHFLLNVTGIPMTEALSVKSKGDAYREYQRTTNAFFPWFPRKMS